MSLLLENGVFLHGADAISHDLEMRNDLHRRHEFEEKYTYMPHLNQPEFKVDTSKTGYDPVVYDSIPRSFYCKSCGSLKSLCVCGSDVNCSINHPGCRNKNIF